MMWAPGARFTSAKRIVLAVRDCREAWKASLPHECGGFHVCPYLCPTPVRYLCPLPRTNWAGRGPGEVGASTRMRSDPPSLRMT